MLMVINGSYWSGEEEGQTGGDETFWKKEDGTQIWDGNFWKSWLEVGYSVIILFLLSGE